MFIGMALADRSKIGKPPIDVTILLNQLVWAEMNNMLNQHYFTTYAVLDALGVSQAQLRRIKFRLWPQANVNNIHSKLFIVDEGLACTVHSAKIEEYSHDRDDSSWRDIGIGIDDRRVSTQFAEYFETLSRQTIPFPCRGYDRDRDLHASCDVRSVQLREQELRSQLSADTPTKKYTRVDRVTPLATDVGRIFNSARRAFVSNIIDVIDSAICSVEVASPNVNDILIYEALIRAYQRGAHVRIMCGRQFNNEAPFLQKYLLGVRTNEIFRQEIAKQQKGISWRYYTRDNEIIKGKSAGAVHAKMIVVDNRITILGSMNVDVFATCCSAEAVTIVEDEHVAEQYRDLFDDWWEEAFAAHQGSETKQKNEHVDKNDAETTTVESA